MQSPLISGDLNPLASWLDRWMDLKDLLCATAVDNNKILYSPVLQRGPWSINMARTRLDYPSRTDRLVDALPNHADKDRRNLLRPVQPTPNSIRVEGRPSNASWTTQILAKVATRFCFLGQATPELMQP
jgi:hypothetical protein